MALAVHDEVLRVAVEAHRGWLFKHTGDGVCAAFSVAEDAVAAAVDAQRRLGLPVRIGIVTGSAELRGDDYFGPALNRAARVMAAGHGGQVLVAAATAALVSGDGLVDLGARRLRDLSGAEHLYQVAGEGLRVEFPPLRTLDSVPGNLPVQATSFVGRHVEVKELCELVRAHRMVTLTGAGGVGKTRLAVQVAGELIGEFPDGVWFVELAPVADAVAVVQAVASVLSVSPEAGATLSGAIVDVVSTRRALLVLDNCEHVIDAAAEIAAALGNGAPQVTVLATSREPLGVIGEQVWGVAALDRGVEAVELFCERARSADHSFDPSEAHLHLVARICERLDRMPLAIELAASRVRSMSLIELNERLADRFAVLRRSARASPVQRHQTLRATVEWSYRLLRVEEQLLFDRLSVFPASFALEAAEAVCGGDPLDPLDVFDLLSSLVDKSLVIFDRDDSGGRYRLLETLRQFGTERLGGNNRLDALRTRHVRHYVAVAERAQRLVHGDGFQQGCEVFDVEWGNLRAALSCALESADEPAACELIVTPLWYAFMFQRHEIGVWAEQALLKGCASAPLQGIAGLFAFQAGEIDKAEQLCRAGIAAAPSPSHPDTLFCWQGLVSCDAHHGLRDELREHVTAYATAAGNAADPFSGAMHYALAALFPSDEAIEYVATAKALRGRLDNPCLDVQIGVAEGIATYAAGERSAAAALLIQARRRAEEAGPYPQAIVSWVIALRAAAAGFDADPDVAYREALTRLHDLREWANLWLTVESLATWWAGTGQFERAGRTLGFLEATGRRFMDLASRRERALATVIAHPHGEAWLAAGARTDRDQLIAYLLDQLAPTD